MNRFHTVYHLRVWYGGAANYQKKNSNCKRPLLGGYVYASIRPSVVRRPVPLSPPSSLQWLSLQGGHPGRELFLCAQA